MEHICIQKETLEKCMNKMDSHISDTARHVEGVQKELMLMRENHLTHIQRATEIQADSAIANERRLASMEAITVKTSTNQEWLMKYHWIIATASIGALVAATLGLFLD